MNEDGFVRRVRRRIDELALREREAERTLEQVRADRQRYESALEVWSREMANGQEPDIHAISPTVDDKELADRTVPEAIALLLRRNPDHEMRTTDIVRRLTVAGVIKAKRKTGAYSSAFKTLKRRADLFFEIERGRWGLVEFRVANTGQNEDGPWSAEQGRLGASD